MSGYQIFVRWDTETTEKSNSGLARHDGYDTVELVDLLTGVAIMSKTFCNNRDRVYGFCLGLVDAFKVLGRELVMPKCLEGRGRQKRHLTPETCRQD